MLSPSWEGTGAGVAQAASTYLGEQRRRSTRLDHTLPVVVRGVDLLGQPFEERTATQVLSFHGCRYASKHHLPKNTWVTLEVTPSQPQREHVRVRARVAWIHRPRTLRELFHVGVELEAGANIWGISVPPEDWNSPVGFSTDPANVAQFPSTRVETPADSVREMSASSQDAQLEQMLAESARHLGLVAPLIPDSPGNEFAPLMREMREHFDAQTRQVLDEARIHAEQLVRDRTAELEKDLHIELRDELKREQRVSAEAFLQRWREEFENEQANARKEISSTLTQQMAAQVDQTKDEIRAKLKAELDGGIEQARTALAEWRRQAEAIQAEARSISESLAGRAEQRLEEKLATQLTSLRQELVSSGVAVPVGVAPSTEDFEQQLVTWRARLESEMAMSRAQWSELIESSLDSAARRLIERLAENSQRLLQSTEQRLSARIAELEQESGRNAESARAAFEEVKSAFDREVMRAKNSLDEFDKAAARLAESAHQAEASRQESVNFLQSRLDAAVASSAAQLEQRAADASRQSEARQQQGEEMLRVHRERLRQVSEQTQRETAEQSAAALENLRNQSEGVRKEALSKCMAELEAAGKRATGDAAALLADTAKSAAAECSESVRKNAEEALLQFSAESSAKIEQNRVHLAAATEQAVQNFQGYAKAALGRFEEQVTGRMDQSTRQSQELLAAQLVATLDSFQDQGDSQVKEWEAKLEAASGAAAERHEGRLRSAGDAWVDTTVRQLEAMGQARLEAIIRVAENAMRKACVQALSGMAETLREEFSREAADAPRTGPQVVSETPKSSQTGLGESKPSERRASA